MEDKLYRYKEVYYSRCVDYEMERFSTEIKIELVEYEIVKETDKSYQITQFGYIKKWIRKNSKKQFASKTKKEAWEHFKKRKESQKRIIQTKLSNVNSILGQIKRLDGEMYEK